jgi:UDP-glucose 4-epimerase
MTTHLSSPPTILLAGGGGYVGCRLANHLASAGWKIVIGSRNPRPIAAFEKLPVEYRTIDWNDASSLVAATTGCDFIVHLAAPNEVTASQSMEEAVLGTVLTTTRLLRAAESAGVSRFLYFSTAHVYGSPLEGLLEESRAAQPRHPYAIAHRCAEDFVLAHRGNMQPVVIRLSNSLGAPLAPSTDRWKLLGNDLCRQVVETGCMKLQSDGSALRDFIPMEDVGRAVRFLLDTKLPATENLYNVGAGRSYSIREIAECVADARESAGHPRPAIEFGPPGPPSPDFQFSVAKFHTLGFRPASTIREEIEMTLRACETWFGHAATPIT